MSLLSVVTTGFGSVRSWLVLIVLACIVPGALAAAFLVYIPYQHERVQAHNAAVSRARAMVSALDREFAKAQAALLALSTSSKLKTGDFAGFHAQALEALANMEADSIVVLDDSGQMVLSTRRPFGQPLPRLEKTPLLARIMTTGRPAVSDLYPAPLTGEPLIAIGVPLWVEGPGRYSLYATMAPRRFSAVLAEQKLRDTWRAAIADSTGTVVARTHDIAKFLGSKVNPELLKRMERADEGAFEAMTLENIPVATAYSRSQIHRWTVVLGTPLEELTADIRRTLYWLIASMLAALAVGLAAAWIIGGRIARSMTGLVEPARALGQGQRVVLPRTALREAAQVGEALQEAEAALRQARHDALHDPLTKLANRMAFNLLLDQELTLCERRKTSLAVLYIDLDGFKAVNDTHGHSTGDSVLRAVAGRLKATVRHSDFAARLGGDEFAIAMVDSDERSACALASTLIDTLSAPYRIADVEASISASVGVAVYPESATDMGALVDKADQAMYAAKAAGKRRVVVATGDVASNMSKE